jgi:large subunit ribosomal protein L7/L12
MADLQVLKEQLGSLTVLEVAQLTQELEEEWGVSAAAPVAVAAVAAADGGAGEVEEEQTEFDVVLTEIGSQKIPVIKVVRELTGLGLKEAKAVVDGAPGPVKEAVSNDDAQAAKEKLEGVGATVEIK